MRKKIVLILCALTVVILVFTIYQVRSFNNLWFQETVNYFNFKYESAPIEFQWSQGTYDDYIEPHEAIIIPVSVDGLPHQFYWQFDTGASFSLLYEGPVNSLKDAGYNIDVQSIGEDRYATHIANLFGQQTLDFRMVKILERYGPSFNENDTLTPIKLGTLGADFMKDKITLIDFKNQHIRLYKERPEWMTDLEGFQPFSFRGRRFMLPVTIDNKEFELFYDSGCSAFGLITSMDRYNLFSNLGDKEVKYEGNRFGESLTIFHKNSDKKVFIGNTELMLKRVSYVDIYAWFQKFMTPFTSIGGWLGNKPFLEHTIIFDTKKEEFIVIDSPALKH